MSALLSTSCRIAAVVLVSTGVVVLAPSPASAHTQTGVSPTNYKSQVRSVTPPDPRLRLRLLELGRLVELRNTGDVEVVVLGYQGEPYLRVGPAGAFENRASPTFEQNKVSTGSGTPNEVEVTATPKWHKVSDSRMVRWRDHRTRWEGPTPPFVRADSNQRHNVANWTIELRRGDDPVVVAGTITWIPPPRATVWLLVFALAMAAALLAAAASSRWGPLVGTGLAVLVAVDVVLSFSSAAYDGRPVTSQLLTLLLGGFLSVAAWVAAALAISWLQEYRQEGVWLGALAGMIILLYGGLGGAFSLGRSLVPFAMPAGLARAGIATSLGLGLGVSLAAPMIWRRHLLPAHTASAEAQKDRRR